MAASNISAAASRFIFGFLYRTSRLRMGFTQCVPWRGTWRGGSGIGAPKTLEGEWKELKVWKRRKEEAGAATKMEQ